MKGRDVLDTCLAMPMELYLVSSTVESPLSAVFHETLEGLQAGTFRTKEQAAYALQATCPATAASPPTTHRTPTTAELGRVRPATKCCRSPAGIALLRHVAPTMVGTRMPRGPWAVVLLTLQRLKPPSHPEGHSLMSLSIHICRGVVRYLENTMSYRLYLYPRCKKTGASSLICLGFHRSLVGGISRHDHADAAFFRC